jgi:hypothetical protein
MLRLSVCVLVGGGGGDGGGGGGVLVVVVAVQSKHTNVEPLPPLPPSI